MKKLLILLFVIIMFTGCSKKNENNKVSILTYKERKSYYSSVVPVVRHDDYNNDIKKEDIYDYGEGQNNSLSVIDDQIKIIDEQNEDISKNEDETKTIAEQDDTIVDNFDIQEKEEYYETKFIVEEKNDDTNILVNEEMKDNDKIIINEDSNVIFNKNEEIITEEIINKPIKEAYGFYSPSGKYLGDTKVKVVDVSYYQGIIDWDKFASDSDCYGVILRLGYYDTLDKMFERNINEIKRLNIPYGIYLFSYATTLNGALKEMNFTNQMINKYNIEPTLGIFYDIESWNTKSSSSDNISKEKYDNIVQLFINGVSNYVSYKYKVKVYSGRWYAMNRLGSIAKSYVDWVAEYNSTCKYDSIYSMWQYTSKGNMPGINGNVDISYLY